MGNALISMNVPLQVLFLAVPVIFIRNVKQSMDMRNGSRYKRVVVRKSATLAHLIAEQVA